MPIETSLESVQTTACLSARATFPADPGDFFACRDDLSRWIADVFGDHALAAELRELEARYRAAPTSDTVPTIVSTIRARYELEA